MHDLSYYYLNIHSPNSPHYHIYSNHHTTITIYKFSINIKSFIIRPKVTKAPRLSAAGEQGVTNGVGHVPIQV